MQVSKRVSILNWPTGFEARAEKSSGFNQSAVCLLISSHRGGGRGGGRGGRGVGDGGGGGGGGSCTCSV